MTQPTCPACGQPLPHPSPLDPIEAVAYIDLTPQQRKLATLLAEHLGRFVPRQTVIDTLWPPGTSLPANTGNNIAVTAHALRHHPDLAKAGLRISTRPRGRNPAWQEPAHGLRMERIPQNKSPTG